MPLFIKNSIIYKLFYCLFINPYNNSILKRFLDKTIFCFKQSFLYKAIQRYIHKEPYFLNSIFYKSFRKIVGLIDKIMDYLHDLIKRCIVFSSLNSDYKNIKAMDRKNKIFFLLGLFILELIFYILFKINFYIPSSLILMIILLFLSKKADGVKRDILVTLSKISLVVGIFVLAFGFKNLVLTLLVLHFIGIIFVNYQFIAYILCFYPFIDFLLRSFNVGLASIWDELLFIAMFGVWFYKYLRYRKEEGVKQTPLDLPIILFLIAMVMVLIINSPDYRIALEGFRAVIQYILWYFVIIQLLRDKKGAKNLCLIFVLVVALMAMHGVYQYIIGVEVPTGWVDSKEVGVRTRVFSILTSPNIFGSLITLALPLTISFANISKNKKVKAMFYIFVLMMLGSLAFTFSRGAWIGFGFAILIYVFLKDKRFLIPVVVLGVLSVLLVPEISNRIAYMLSPEYIESSLKGGRLVRWITGIKILEGTPVFGVGLGHFGGAVAINNNLSYLVDGKMIKTFYMDNYYLKTAVETGLFGLFAFLMLMYQVIINGFRTITITKDTACRELEIGIFAGLFGVIIHNFVENVFEVPMMTSCFWLLTAVLMHFWYINYNEQKFNK